MNNFSRGKWSIAIFLLVIIITYYTKINTNEIQFKYDSSLNLSILRRLIIIIDQ